MPLPQNTISPQVEHTLIELFDAVLDSETGVILYKCTRGQANYLIKWAGFLRDSSAVASVELYEETHPLFGLGSYWNLAWTATDNGLLVRRVETPVLSAAQVLVRAATTQRSTQIEMGSPKEAQRFVNAMNASRAALIRKGVSEDALARVHIDRDGAQITLLTTRTRVRQRILEVTDEKEASKPLPEEFDEDR